LSIILRNIAIYLLTNHSGKLKGFLRRVQEIIMNVMDTTIPIIAIEGIIIGPAYTGLSGG
jgi:hypothetical protein